MKSAGGGNDILGQYLLGILPPEHRAPLEERLLTDGSFYEELSIAEDELIDRYLTAGLTDAEREGFETYFLLAPERRRKLRFARALRRYVGTEAARPHEAAAESTEQSPDPPPVFVGQNPLKLLLARRPALLFSMTAAALLLIAVVSWVAISRRPFARPEPSRVFAVALTPGLVREAGEIKKITIPPTADALLLQLELPADDYPTYRAELQTAEGRTVHTSDNLKAGDVDGRRMVEFNAPREDLPAGDYQLRLNGLSSRGDAEPVGRYYFRVTGR